MIPTKSAQPIPTIFQIINEPLSNKRAESLLIDLCDPVYKQWFEAGKAGYGLNKSLWYEYAKAGGHGSMSFNEKRLHAFATGWMVSKWGEGLE